MTPREYIDGKDGPAAMSRATGHKSGAIALWRHRNKIPRAAWPELLDAYPDTTIDQLKAMEREGIRTPGVAPAARGQAAA